MSSTASSPARCPPDMRLLANELLELLGPLRTVLVHSMPQEDTCPDRPAPAMILEPDAIADLGHPRCESSWCTLLVHASGRAPDWSVTIAGPDVPHMPHGYRGPLGVALLLSLAVCDDADPLIIDRLPFAPLRVNGMMIRSAPGRVWIRAAQRPVGPPSLVQLGTAWLAACRSRIPTLRGGQIVFVTSSNDAVLAMRPIAAQARLLAGEHRKRSLGVDGEIDCADATCGTCEDKPVCDGLRDIARRRRA